MNARSGNLEAAAATAATNIRDGRRWWNDGEPPLQADYDRAARVVLRPATTKHEREKDAINQRHYRLTADIPSTVAELLHMYPQQHCAIRYSPSPVVRILVELPGTDPVMEGDLLPVLLSDPDGEIKQHVEQRLAAVRARPEQVGATVSDLLDQAPGERSTA